MVKYVFNRAILKLTKKMPGPECETFEQVKEWVETTCEKRSRPSPSRSTRVADDGIAINVEFSETEYGRASYSVRRSGSSAFHISAEDLMEMVQTAVDGGEGIDEIVDRVAEKIDDDAWDECDPNMDGGTAFYQILRCVILAPVHPVDG